MTAANPRTVDQYLDALRAALHGADPALVQDALFDAEEHLRAELAQHPGDAEGDVLARIVSSYGAPDEVADAYRANEATIQKALRTPVPRAYGSAIGRFFGVFADPRAYLCLLYLLLTLVTGIVYFTFAVTGLSLSIGLAILIIGVPFFLVFIGVRGSSRSRRDASSSRCSGYACRAGRRIPTATRRCWQRIGEMLKDPRTWGTLLYQVADAAARHLLLHVRGRRHRRLACDLILAPIVVLLYHAGLIQIDGTVDSPLTSAAAADLDPRTPAAYDHDAPRARTRIPAWSTGEERCSYLLALAGLIHGRRSSPRCSLRSLPCSASACGHADDPAAPEEATTPAGCRTDPASCVSADAKARCALGCSGEIDAEIEWGDGGEPHCRGSVRPSGRRPAPRSTSGTVPDATGPLLIVFGRGTAAPGRVRTQRAGEPDAGARGHGTVLRHAVATTNVRSTCSARRRWQARRTSYRLEGRGYCTQPARASGRRPAVLVSRFDVVAIVDAFDRCRRHGTSPE
jgi:uncharacterized membrane protein